MKAFMCDLARRAGALAMAYRQRLAELRVDVKGARDVVTEADVAVERLILGEIAERYPEHAVLGEESGSRAGNKYRWIVDPIDGTV